MKSKIAFVIAVIGAGLFFGRYILIALAIAFGSAIVGLAVIAGKRAPPANRPEYPVCRHEIKRFYREIAGCKYEIQHFTYEIPVSPGEIPPTYFPNCNGISEIPPQYDELDEYWGRGRGGPWPY